MANPMDMNGNASAALMGGAKATSAMGLGQPNAVAGLRPPNPAMGMPVAPSPSGAGNGLVAPTAGLSPGFDPVAAQQQLDIGNAQLTQLPATPQEPSGPMIGFNPRTDQVYAGGTILPGGNLSVLADADKQDSSADFVDYTDFHKTFRLHPICKICEICGLIRNQ